MSTKRLPYWVKRHQEQGEKTVGNKAFNQEKFEAKSLQAASLLSSFLFEHGITGGKILDAGCGVGRLSGTLIPRFFDEVQGIDIVPWAIERAKINCPLGNFQVFDGVTIPFPDGHFDAALSWTVLQHIPPDEIEQACSELERVIRPGGNLILYENTSTWEKDGEHIWFRSMEEYQRLFPQSELVANRVVEKADDTPQEHLLMLFEKGEK